jgi:osmotically-inducible protein OsmY
MPEQVEDADDPYVEAHVHEALAQDPRVGELGIEVRIADGVVSLAGAVPTRERRDAIEAVVRELLPGHELDNGVVVEDAGPGGEAEVIG